MPPPLDLAGRTFGRLVVVRRGPKVKFGSWQPGWVCRCECGAELVVPQGRLPHRPTIPASHVVDACPACRGRPCVVCGANVPLSGRGHGRRATCSPAHEESHRKAKQRASWKRRVAADPDLPRKMNARRRERAAADSDYAARLAAWERARELRRQERRRADPDYAARLRAKSRETYARHAERIQAERRARVDAMTPAEREEWCRRAAAYTRRWQRRHLADLKADPDAHRRYRDIQNEYRRQWHALKAGPPPVRVCVVCGDGFESRQYRVLCDDPDCHAAYGRQKQAASRGRNLFRELERELTRRAHVLDQDAGPARRTGGCPDRL
jgi:hypothetical protein